MTYSTYKHHSTAFVSDLYADEAETNNWHLLAAYCIAGKGDSITTDKGFDIQSEQ